MKKKIALITLMLMFAVQVSSTPTTSADSYSPTAIWLIGT
ncbi:hypothetical protein B795N_20040 [Marinilactibacillus psychrotolerans]|uniref:Uncharacterized protein n=2 Tax=Marinilactibacillus psychrotolerans TaxID=191770 RepID=A0AAV3WWR4_9LACT|nr:hypothetical protein MPS01_12060 [Marinilactibacillus psychrotolerans]GEQ34122.1 hypothetical protein B795N_20040 [Marinilactibacillus psychrotolerans]GEQ36196.1 hypothetical protein M132T_17040 [Marinilactibacillus psychrotolerans]SJN25422.1 hypothetical protein FM115_03355 [Marinilactibacillus psychrotolerans 42ea]